MKGKRTSRSGEALRRAGFRKKLSERGGGWLHRFNSSSSFNDDRKRRRRRRKSSSLGNSRSISGGIIRIARRDQIQTPSTNSVTHKEPKRGKTFFSFLSWGEGGGKEGKTKIRPHLMGRTEKERETLPRLLLLLLLRPSLNSDSHPISFARALLPPARDSRADPEK